MRRTSMSALAASALVAAPFVRRLITLAALTALVLLLVGATQAGAAVQRSDGMFPFSFPVTNPCNGETGTLAGTDTVSTLVDDTANHSLYESTTRTDETFTPDNPAEPIASGHGASHTSFVDNHAAGPPFSGTDVYTDVSTSVFHAAGATLVIHNSAHVTVVDGGTLVVSFNRPVLVCEGL
jgi:hypothetical protein